MASLDDVMMGTKPAPQAAPSLPQASDEELIARAALAEGDRGDPESQRNVAGVIRNRMAREGKTAAQVLAAPGQFEAYSNGRIQSVNPNSPAYRAALAATQGVKAGDVPYDAFYSPAIVAQRGHGTPPFDPAAGQKIGSQLFGVRAPSGDLDSILSSEDRAALAAEGDPRAAIEPTPGTPKPGHPANPQADTLKYLHLHGLYDPNGDAGASPQTPVAETETSGPPTKPGTWYIPRAGGLRQVGVDQDFLPQIRQSVMANEAQKSKPLFDQVMENVAQGAFGDTPQSVNKLTGGALSTPGATIDPGTGQIIIPALGQAEGETNQIRQGSLAQGQAQQESFNALTRGQSPIASAGRFAGQVAPALAILGPGAAPEDIGLGANALTRTLGRAGLGAVTGAEASGLTSATSERPLPEQIMTGALTGGVAGPAIPAAEDAVLGAGAKMAGMGRLPAPVADLADTAINKYGIPLTRDQIMAASGDREAGTRWSNMFSEGGSGVAGRYAQQQQAVTRAAIQAFGGDASGAVPDAINKTVMAGARSRIVGVMNDVAQRTDIADTRGLEARLAQIESEAAQTPLGDNGSAALQAQIDNIRSAIKGGNLSGEDYQTLTRSNAPLDRTLHARDPNTAHLGMQIKDALDDALEANAAPQDTQALQNARWEYKNLMTAARISDKADVEGNLPSRLLAGAVRANFKQAPFKGAGDLGELGLIHRTFLTEPPNSYTAPRILESLKRNAVSLGLEGGAAGALGLMHDPGLALKIAGAGAAAFAAKRGSNLLYNARNSPAATQLLLDVQNPGSIGNLLLRRGQLTGGQPYLPAATIGVNRLLLAPPAVRESPN